jgi:hypothetical protein
MQSLFSRVIDSVVERLSKMIAEDVIGAGLLLVAIVRPFLVGEQQAAWVATEEGAWVLCLILAYHWIRAIVVVWKEVSNRLVIREVESPLYSADERKQRHFVQEEAPMYFQFKLATIGVIFIAVLGGALFTVHFVAFKHSIAPPLPHVTELPTVEARYLPSELPFWVSPSSSVYLLRINRKLNTWGADEIRNPSDKDRMEYPPRFSKKRTSGYPGELSICEITNHGDKDLVDVKMSFHVSFRSITVIPVTAKRQGKGFSVTIPTRGREGLTWVHGQGLSVSGFTEGEEVSSQDNWVVLPSISAHQTGLVYLVNASYFPVRFDLPTKVVALVAGSDKEQEVNLIRPRVGVYDYYPWWGMVPSSYKWPGTPDDQ